MRFHPIGDAGCSLPLRAFANDPYVAHILNGSLLVDGMVGPPAGSGVSTHSLEATKKALSEMVDRRALMRGGVARHGEVQTWDLIQGTLSSLPRELTTYQRQRPYPVDTTGTAAHPDSMVAIRNAVLELIEKNALFLFWYGRRGEHVTLESYASDSFAQVFTQSDFDLDIYMNDFFSPVQVAIAIAHSADRFVLMGAGADTDPHTAMDHAVQEAYLIGWSKVADSHQPAKSKPWQRASLELMDHIDGMKLLPTVHASSAVPLVRLPDPLEVLRQSLPRWVASLHIVFLPQNVAPTLRAVTAFSYEMYSHILNPSYLAPGRAVNRLTLQLSESEIQNVPRCPLS